MSQIEQKLLKLLLSSTMACLLVSCTDGFESLSQSSFGLIGDIPAEKLTFAEHIAPMVQQHCTSCHHRGDSIAPFPLENYQDIMNFADAIEFAIANRTMPPPGVDNSGDCQEFTDVNYMSDEKIKAFTDWAEAGHREGRQIANLVAPTSNNRMTSPDTVAVIDQAYTPQPAAGELDDYRCFVVDPQVAADTLIHDIEFRSESIEMVHHVIFFKPTDQAAEDQAIAQSGSDGQPGYSCFGSSGVAASIMGAWVPGEDSGAMTDPDTGEALGLPIEAGRKLIMQIHYNTQNGLSADSTSSVALKFNPQAKPVKWVLLADFLLNLAPGQSNVLESSTQGISTMLQATNFYEQGFSTEALLNPPAARDLTIYAVAPHMHTLGKSVKIEKVEGSRNVCLADVPQWDFNWQGGYSYKKPIKVGAGDQLKISCNFSTETMTETVTFGEGTNDEMCLAFVLTSE